MSVGYLLVGSFFSPIIGLGTLLLNIKKTIPSKMTVVLLSWIIAIIGIYWFPWGDSQSHFYTYSMDFVELYFNYTPSILQSSYWLYDLVIFHIANLMGNYVYGYMFWLFTPLAIFSLSVWSKFLMYNKDKDDYLLLFILLFVIIGVREFLDLNRSTSAALFFVSGLILKDKKCYGWILFSLMCVIAFLLHDMVKIFVLLIPLFCFALKIIKSSRGWIIIALIALMLSMFIKTNILPHVLSDRNAEMYLDGMWGTGSGVQSGFMYMCGWLNVITFLLLYLYIIKNIKNIKNKWLLCLFISSSIITFACFGLWTIRERFTILNIISGGALLITEWKNFLPRKLFVAKTVISVSCLKFVLIMMLHYSALFIHRSASNDPNVSVAITSRIFYIPTPFLMDVNQFGYSDKMYNKLYNRANYGG